MRQPKYGKAPLNKAVADSRQALKTEVLPKEPRVQSQIDVKRAKVPIASAYFVEAHFIDNLF